MKAARIVVLGVALVAGGMAALLVGREQPKPVEVAAPPPPALETVDVLVASGDIAMGGAVAARSFQWQTWPAASTSSHFIRRSSRPKAIEELSGSIARAPFTAGEPIRENKLVKADGSGFMAAILPAGMRAISTEISPETGAGGFILPNDRVDVILTRRDRSGATELLTTETILVGVRVLAIDQSVEDKNGQRVVVGKTATLELAPRQAETLALARQQGVLSLALRSLIDANKPVTADTGPRGDRINTVRFGITTTTVPK